MEHGFFREEDRKYSSLWADNYASANWSVLARTVARHFPASLPYRKKLIDFGFGNGESLNFFEQRGFKVAGVDISVYAVEKQREKGRTVHHASIDVMPMLRDNEYEIGFCNDVLEHLPTPCIAPALREMIRICSEVLYISVCPTLSHALSKNGENLHLTVQPKKWWDIQLIQFGEIKYLWRPFRRSLRYILYPYKSDLYP